LLLPPYKITVSSLAMPRSDSRAPNPDRPTKSVRPGFSAVRVQVGITGPETPERYQQLAAAVDEHCPVLDLFRDPVPVDRTITVG
jgi:hypothetical protein